MKRELKELKKQFTPANCAITRIEGFLVSSEKEIETSFNTQFLSLPEEEMFKYFDIFKKALSGKRGKTMHSLKLRNQYGRESLKNVRDGRLKEIVYDIEFAEELAEYRESVEQFAIIIVHAVYDIPGRATDGMEMEDASEDVYEFMLCCLCPVQLSSAGLCYDKEKRKIENGKRSWMVGMPDTAFVYPAFTDRNTDYDHVWYYSSSAKKLEKQIITEVLGCELPKMQTEQMEDFGKMLAVTAAGKVDMDQTKEMFKQMYELVLICEEHDSTVDKKELENVLVSAGIDREVAADGVDQLGKEDIIIQNVIDQKNFKLETYSAKITIDAERMDLVEMKKIDGEDYILIKATADVYINGVEIKK